MAKLNNVSAVKHRIRCKLYPNHLPGGGGGFIARTNNEASLSIKQVCAALKDRGGFKGNIDELVDFVHQFFDEAAYQLCDGYSINAGYFTVYPNVGGTFSSVNETHDHKKHPLGFRFRTNAPLRELARHIVIDIEGLANGSGFINRFVDIDENSLNRLFIPGNQFCISGHKIKIAGDDPNVGVFFVPVDDPSKAVKVERIAENSSSKIIGIAPRTGYIHNIIEIRTQFTGSNATFLKEPRIIASSFIIEAA